MRALQISLKFIKIIPKYNEFQWFAFRAFLQKLHRRHPPKVDKITSQISIWRDPQDDPKTTNIYMVYLDPECGVLMW